MRRVTIMFVGLILGVCLLCQGCESSVAAGADVRATYTWDVLKAKMDYPIDEVFNAASNAVDQLDLKVMWHDQDGVAGEVATLDAQRENITIDVEALPGSRTILTIRAGIFGDKNKSEVIFEQIMENLRQEAAVARL